jgi:hypothetical protein
VILGLRKKGALTSGMSFISLRLFSFGSLLTCKISAFVPVTGAARFVRCLPGVVLHRLSWRRSCLSYQGRVVSITRSSGQKREEEGDGDAFVSVTRVRSISRPNKNQEFKEKVILIYSSSHCHALPEMEKFSKWRVSSPSPCLTWGLTAPCRTTELASSRFSLPFPRKPVHLSDSTHTRPSPLPHQSPAVLSSLSLLASMSSLSGFRTKSWIRRSRGS